MASPTKPEWFTEPDAPEGGAGLRFGCTMCGRCCSGPSGYVQLSDDECAKLAARLGIPVERFIAQYTHEWEKSRSLNEVPSAFGLDCIFLDRQTIPGKAVCGVYEDRPIQCKTWPFWPSLLKSRRDWDDASTRCPGMNKGTLVPIEQVRVLRDQCDI